MYLRKLDGAEPYTPDMTLAIQSPNLSTIDGVGAALARDLAATGTLECATPYHPTRSQWTDEDVNHTQYSPESQIIELVYAADPEDLSEVQPPTERMPLLELIGHLTRIAVENGDARFIGHERAIAKTVIKHFPYKRTGRGVTHAFGV